jgi:hypothetical protein
MDLEGHQKLTNDADFCCKLFSRDSTSEAKEQQQKKTKGHEGKLILFGELADYVFKTSAEKISYKANAMHYTKSTQQHFTRYTVHHVS